MNPNPEKNSGNLVVLESTGFAPTNKDVAGGLREWANAIENSECCYGNVILVMEVDGRVRRSVMGGHIDRSRVIGLLFDAATRAVGDCAGWHDDPSFGPNSG